MFRTVAIAIFISVRCKIIFPIRPIIRPTPTFQRYVCQYPVIPIIAIPHFVDIYWCKEVIWFAFLLVSLSEIVQVSKLVPSPDMARIVLLGVFRWLLGLLGPQIVVEVQVRLLAMLRGLLVKWRWLRLWVSWWLWVLRWHLFRLLVCWSYVRVLRWWYVTSWLRTCWFTSENLVLSDYFTVVLIDWTVHLGLLEVSGRYIFSVVLVLSVYILIWLYWAFALNGAELWLFLGNRNHLFGLPLFQLRLQMMNPVNILLFLSLKIIDFIRKS